MLAEDEQRDHWQLNAQQIDIEGTNKQIFCKLCTNQIQTYKVDPQYQTSILVFAQTKG